MRERDSVGTVEDLLASASKITGLDDFGGDGFLPALRVLVDSMNNEAGLTGLGNSWQRSNVRSALVQRLVAESGFAAHPEHAEVAIERPIFVTGMRRSGTTMVQRLLGADPTTQSLEMWLTQFPQPRPPRESWDDNPVFQQLKAGFDAHHAHSPELAGIHYTHADTSEECWYLLQQELLSAAFPALGHLPSYRDLLQDPDTDWTGAYQRHRKNLQLIGLNDPGKRWVLKNPSHLGTLDTLIETYPDAVIVQTHRDPVVAITSSCSLAAVSTRGWSDVFVGAQLGNDILDWAAWELERFADVRARNPQVNVIDVDYRDLVADPVTVIKGIYAEADLPWGDELQGIMAAEVAASKTGVRAPGHRYDLADYGLTPQDIHDRLRGALA